MEAKLKEMALKTALIIGLASAGIYYFMVFKYPNEQVVIDSLQANLNEAEGEIKRLDKEIAQENAINDELEASKKEIKALSSYFKNADDSKTIEQTISEEARASGISFDSIQREEIYAQQDFSDQAAEFSIKDYVEREVIQTRFSGSFVQLMRFLSYLTRTKQVISLKEMSVSAESSQDNSTSVKKAQLSFNAKFETYKLIRNLNVETMVKPPAVNPNDPGGVPNE